MQYIASTSEFYSCFFLRAFHASISMRLNSHRQNRCKCYSMQFIPLSTFVSLVENNIHLRPVNLMNFSPALPSQQKEDFLFFLALTLGTLLSIFSSLLFSSLLLFFHCHCGHWVAAWVNSPRVNLLDYHCKTISPMSAPSAPLSLFKLKHWGSGREKKEGKKKKPDPKERESEWMWMLPAFFGGEFLQLLISAHPHHRERYFIVYDPRENVSACWDGEFCEKMVNFIRDQS